MLHNPDHLAAQVAHDDDVDAHQAAIIAELTGIRIASASGVTVEANTPVLDLCRKLIAIGISPKARLEAYRGDVLCLRVRSIREAAQLELNGHGTGFKPVGGGGRASPMRRTAAAGISPHRSGRRSRTSRLDLRQYRRTSAETERSRS